METHISFGVLKSWTSIEVHFALPYTSEKPARRSESKQHVEQGLDRDLMTSQNGNMRAEAESEGLKYISVNILLAEVLVDRDSHMHVSPQSF